MRIIKSLVIVFVSAIVFFCVGCRSGFLKSGKYISVDNSEYYVTINGENITLNNPCLNEHVYEFHQRISYTRKVSEIESKGIILTDEEKEQLQKDLPDFNPDVYIGKTYKLEFMNKETYVKGDIYDIMLWDNDTPVEIFSGEFNPDTGILTIGGAEYKPGK